MGTQVVHVEVTGKDGAKLQQFFKDVFDWASTRSPSGWTACTVRATGSLAGSAAHRTAAPVG